MNLTAELIVGPLASALIVGGVSYVAVRVSLAKLEQRLADKDKSDDRRFKQVEDYIGITSGNGSAFVRKGECVLIHKATEQEVGRLRDEVDGIRDEFAGRLEHVDLRLAAVEQRP